MIRQEIKEIINKAVSSANLGKPEFSVEHPEDKNHGDYAANIAMRLAKIFKTPPMKIAEDLRPRILNIRPDLFEKIDIIEPGFINFFVSPQYLQNQISEILNQKESFGGIKLGDGKKVSIESVSANPTGQLHIGNGRNAFAGDVLANILEKAGYKAVREYFVNDAKNSKQIIELGKTALGKGETYLNDYLKSKISLRLASLAQGKQNSKLSEGEAGYLLAQDIQEDTRNFLAKKLKVRFDKWISEEKDIYRKNKIKKILDWLKKNNFVYQKDGACPPTKRGQGGEKYDKVSPRCGGGAWWLKTSQFGDEKDWVAVRETGEPTYLLSDIAYHKEKFDRGFDKVIDIWGADHQAHVSKIKAAAKMLGFNGSLDILVLQLVALRGGEKMSKRAGNIITLEELVDEIGIDVARWFYLQKSLDTHMEIDLELAKEQSEKNPVFYVQYAHARICSILRQPETNKLKPITKNLKSLNHPSELNLIKQLIRLPEVIEDTANDYQVQRLPQYAMDLAATFHQFYRDCRVISKDKNLIAARLSLVSAAKIALKNTLSLMGIAAPEKM